MTDKQVLTAQKFYIEALEDPEAAQAAEEILQQLNEQLEAEDANGLLIGLSGADTIRTMHNLIFQTPQIQWIVSQSVGGEEFLPIIEYKTDMHPSYKRVRLLVITSNVDQSNLHSLARNIFAKSRENTEIYNLVITTDRTSDSLKGYLPDINFEII